MAQTEQPAKLTHWMIYGAYGYTGELIAREAVKRGLNPILGGRDKYKTQELADELGLRAVAFDLDNPEHTASHLSNVSLVLNCAGPFSSTARVMMEACINAGTHYLDITGEIAVFEFAQSLKESALNAKVLLCPGVGFDVIPTDCVTATLSSALPDATHLALGFDSRSAFSPGTAKTSVEGLAQGGKIRRNGDIITVPLAYKVRQIDFGDKEKLAMTIPWGDVSTAYHTTGIPNIEVYIPSSEKMVKNVKRANLIRPLLGSRWVQSLLKSHIGKKIKGPDEAQREETKTYVWGEAKNAKGMKKTVRILTTNGYDLTVTGSLAIVEHLLKSHSVSGVYTPSKLMGADFVSQLPGCSTFQFEK
ncbi:saccharopine dehydrogenase NADP-binding domain-containing protein [Vibrio natriegens]|uniref:saccharopine dehydrogenase family protein n=1 Tax=Vibrio natriegens TaxID=691 RepID=UPI001EFD4316|nr:saccharopine dehydrogenase NADP-binding domain-containing protein [Vibrio natriegens]MCG9702201.1 saccharopine dehydrogenase NADP-binding domain-containing protein [Vibrio natriegens]